MAHEQETPIADELAGGARLWDVLGREYWAAPAAVELPEPADWQTLLEEGRL
jgi:hypothetical protein